MTDAPATSAPRKRLWRRLRIGWLLLAMVFTVLGYFAWQEHNFRKAIERANSFGWKWKYNDPIEAIRKDWTAAFQRETWIDDARELTIWRADQLDGRGSESLLLTLNPRTLILGTTIITMYGGGENWPYALPCGLMNLDSLKGLTQLQELSVIGLIQLENVDALQTLPGLKKLSIFNCNIRNLDGIKGLSQLEDLMFQECKLSTSMDVLKDLAALRKLRFSWVKSVNDWSALKELRSLQLLELISCEGVRPLDITEINNALRNTQVSFQ